MGHYSSFVVKLWVNDDGIMKRGHVQHVATQDGIYFLDFDKMVDFMCSNLNSCRNGSVKSPDSTGLNKLANEDEDISRI